MGIFINKWSVVGCAIDLAVSHTIPSNDIHFLPFQQNPFDIENLAKALAIGAADAKVLYESADKLHPDHEVIIDGPRSGIYRYSILINIFRTI